MKKVGIGSRVLNFLIDNAVVFLIAYIANRIQDWYGYYYEFRTWNFGWVFAAATVLYYTLLEGTWGRTLGKKLSFSKVIKANGRKPGLLLAFIRSLIRLTIIDMLFLPFKDRTLHDMLSKTDVVEI